MIKFMAYRIVYFSIIFFYLFREQYDLRHTIQVMVDLGVTFVQVKSAEGHYVFQTEPDLDTLCSFPGKIINYSQ